MRGTKAGSPLRNVRKLKTRCDRFAAPGVGTSSSLPSLSEPQALSPINRAGSRSRKLPVKLGQQARAATRSLRNSVQEMVGRDANALTESSQDLGIVHPVVALFQA
jgi:hypothetical protein